MTEAEREQLLTEFTNALRIGQALDLSKPADALLYTEGLHGSRDAVRRLATEIRRIEGGGVFLFAGQPGSGKSTELMRLKGLLAGPMLKVYYCDLEDWLNLNEPVTLGSFLVALLASWVDQAGTTDGQQTLVQRFIGFLHSTQLVPESLELGADGAGLKASLSLALRTDPDFRQKIEAAIKGRRSSIVQHAHDFVSQLVESLCPQGEKCVLVADSLEKIRGYGEQQGDVYSSLQSLFLSDGAALKLPGVHVVYSVSPFLIEQNNQLPALLGTGAVTTMPSVHVFKQRSAVPDNEGVDAMVEVVLKRFDRSLEVFEERQLRTLALGSGGDLRDFLRSIRIVLADEIEGFPVSDEMVSFALAQVCPPKQIPNDHIQWLARLDASHEGELSGDISALTLQQYLASKHVLVYLNGEAWFSAHPLLRDWVRQRSASLPPPSAPA